MSHHNDHQEPNRSDSVSPSSKTRRGRTPFLVGVAAVGGLILAPQVLPASAEPLVVSGQSSTQAVSLLALTPPPGESWIQGRLTDQAGHKLNNVNVEAWPMDPNAGVPVASNLSYAGAPADGRHQSGVFRLAVPGGTPYRLMLSTIDGQEDGDLFRAQTYGNGAIMTRATAAGQRTTVAKVMAVPGRVIDLGKVPLARQGTVDSKTQARLGNAKVKASKRAKLNVRVSSPFVSNVTGKVRGQDLRPEEEDHRAPDGHGQGEGEDQASQAGPRPLLGQGEVRRLQHRQVLEGQPGDAQGEVIAAAASSATPLVRA